MKLRILSFVYSVMQFIAECRILGASKGHKPATSESIYKPYIRDSEGRTEGEPKMPEKEKDREYQPIYRLHSKEHLTELKKAFPQSRWKPGMTVEELAFNAGQQSVLDSIEARLSAEGRKAHVLT